MLVYLLIGAHSSHPLDFFKIFLYNMAWQFADLDWNMYFIVLFEITWCFSHGVKDMFMHTANGKFKANGHIS